MRVERLETSVGRKDSRGTALWGKRVKKGEALRKEKQQVRVKVGFTRSERPR